jgi:hypothetical protein
LGAAAASCPLVAAGGLPVAADAAGPPPVVHLTDLFRPYGDPDDHWDLATLFALAGQGRIDVRAVMIDFPPPRRGKVDPDVLAVAQMSYLTGIPVPILVGCPQLLQSRTQRVEKCTGPDWGGVRNLLRILRDAPRRVALHIVGTCNDVALAGRIEPQLFAEKCAAIYLNAGAGTQDPVKRKKLEYNVGLNPAAYAALFDLPCTIYWLPCFEDVGNSAAPAAYGTYYRFRHEEILPHLSRPLQNYFTSMYADGEQAARQQGPHTWWLQTLLGPAQETVLAKQLPLYRNMWSTAGLFHGAGLTVACDGRIVPLGQAGVEPVYEFQPIRVRAGDDGLTEWHEDAAAGDRYIFHVRDVPHYAAAMTAALCALLKSLG